jgi:hypothetical protein
MVVGGQGKADACGREVWCLDLASMAWVAPSTAQQAWATAQASCCPIGRTKARP